MSRLHFLNVGSGDCIVIEHESGRVTVIDICGGNRDEGALAKSIREMLVPSIKGNFRMCQSPTNPLNYLTAIGCNSIWRFILTHPDMDHLDGFAKLVSTVPILNYWDSGLRRDEDVDCAGSPYNQKDWDEYKKVRDGATTTQVISVKCDSHFQYANQAEGGVPGGDGLHILAPTPALVNEGNETACTNDASYAILYKSFGVKLLLPGDSHDKTWAHMLKDHQQDIKNCDILLAPHHGRDSDCDFSFLDVVLPRLSLFGCAPSEHLAYGEWGKRNLAKITNNQAGNIVLEIGAAGIEVYVENATFVDAVGGNSAVKNTQGYSLLVSLPTT